MYESQAGLCDLFELIHQADSRPLYWHSLAPWVESHGDEVEWLRSFASRSGSPIPAADAEDLCRLYALSRVNETLLLSFQRGRADGTDWPGPKISLDEYLLFAHSLGLAIVEPVSFSPFHHEIVQVEEAKDDDQPVAVTSMLWPCLMLGDMVLSRAGVHVCGGSRFLRKGVAESSTLYWAYWRKNRPTQDLSQGWGSNSQWRTCFRRDYRVGRELHFNVDGKQDLSLVDKEAEHWTGLTVEERIELLTNRCFVRTAKADDDLWPYHDMLRTEE